MGTEGGGLRPDERREWDERGFFIRRGFADDSVTRAMLDEVVAVCRRAAADEDIRLFETRL